MALAADPIEARVSAIIDGDTIVLAEPVKEAREVRLVGIGAPKPPLNRPNTIAWPLADEAREELARLSVDRRFNLEFTGRDFDRHGRLLAHLRRDDGLWLQAAMLHAGLARVYTFAENRRHAGEMLALEREARDEGRGIWGHPHYAIRTPAEVRYDIDSFQLVEGRIVKAVRVGQWVYLNFGPNWRTDFTVSIKASFLPRFEEAGLDPLRLSGAEVRVRGWVKSLNGPLITLNHAEPLEVLAR